MRCPLDAGGDVRHTTKREEPFTVVQESREELIADVDELKKKISGDKTTV